MRLKLKAPTHLTLMHITAAQDRTAAQFVDLIASKLGSGRAVHPETAIASAARLAGSLLFRSFDLSVHGTRAGDVVLSHQANEEGVHLVNLLATMLHHFGVLLNQEQLGSDMANRGGAPELSVMESLALLQQDAIRIARAEGLALKDAAWAAAIATAFIVKECAKDIGAEVGFNIAAFGFVEGSKTMPPACAADSAKPSDKRPWYKFW